MASMGYEGKIAIGAGETVIQASNITLGKRGRILERDGMRGVREHHVRDTRTGPYNVAGGFTCEPSPTELAMLLDWAIDDDSADVTVDRVLAAYLYPDCKVNTFRLSGTQGGLIVCGVELVGTTEEAGDALDDPESTSPYAYAPDLALTLVGSSTRDPQSFELFIDNQLDAERFLNSLTLAEVNSQDQIVRLRAVLPFTTANLALYDQALAGAAGSIKLSQDGFTDLTISFARLQVPAESPPISKSEIFLTLNMEARAEGATPAIDATGGAAS